MVLGYECFIGCVLVVLRWWGSFGVFWSAQSLVFVVCGGSDASNRCLVFFF